MKISRVRSYTDPSIVFKTMLAAISKGINILDNPLIAVIPIELYKYDLSSDILKFNRVEAQLTEAGEYEIVKPIEIHKLEASV